MFSIFCSFPYCYCKNWKHNMLVAISQQIQKERTSTLYPVRMSNYLDTPKQKKEGTLSLCKSAQFFEHLYGKLNNRNWGNSIIKSRIKSPCVKLKCIICLKFFFFSGGKTGSPFQVAGNKRALKLSHIWFKTNIWNYHSYFPRHLLIEQRKKFVE